MVQPITCLVTATQAHSQAWLRLFRLRSSSSKSLQNHLNTHPQAAPPPTCAALNIQACTYVPQPITCLFISIQAHLQAWLRLFRPRSSSSKSLQNHLNTPSPGCSSTNLCCPKHPGLHIRPTARNLPVYRHPGPLAGLGVGDGCGCGKLSRRPVWNKKTVWFF